jgi:hypothetical protein
LEQYAVAQSRRGAAAACRELGALEGALGGLIYHESGGDDIARSYEIETRHASGEMGEMDMMTYQSRGH